MDASELAINMLEWERKKRDLDELEALIEEAVLGLGKTQTVGNVRAEYNAGEYGWPPFVSLELEAK